MVVPRFTTREIVGSILIMDTKVIRNYPSCRVKMYLSIKNCICEIWLEYVFVVGGHYETGNTRKLTVIFNHLSEIMSFL